MAKYMEHDQYGENQLRYWQTGDSDLWLRQVSYMTNGFAWHSHDRDKIQQNFLQWVLNAI